jgi:hypothetical protein
MQRPLESALRQTRKPQQHKATLHFCKTARLDFATQGIAHKTPRRSLHAGKDPNGVRWKNLLRRYRVRRLPEKFIFLELAKGFEPPTL